ncbi:MAG: hypothetical protein DCC55_30470 [Chloroflexi bacterium]|nr:MAG: hypothetical protein DCC55_30470 [Chloroflexota bacterium]
MTQHLRISDNGRFLVRTDGTPFFWLGDTAWELFHRLNREEADRYLANRAQKGFTIIQAVALAERHGLTEPNANGDLPLVGHDPARPNEAYFAHVDSIVRKAAELGLVVGMLPTWGSYWKRDNVNAIFTAENARTYARFLGARYRNSPIVWILGGDNNISNNEERAIIEAMAAGIKEGDGGDHLITFHPRGPGVSSDHFHMAEWLDFNMIQSSHGARNHDNGLMVARDYARRPIKPVVDGEPRYETIPVGFYFRNVDLYDRFDAFDVRQAAYWALLAGAYGHTYGNNNVWQMWAPGREVVIGANTPWWEALDHPGAFQMGWVRRLFDSRPFTKLVPAQEMVLDAPSSGGAKVRAACAEDGSFAFIYSPMGAPFTVDLARIQASRVKEIWYDPRYGASYHSHTTANMGFQTYTPPSAGRGLDWVLVLEDEAAGFPLPGSQL